MDALATKKIFSIPFVIHPIEDVIATIETWIGEPLSVQKARLGKRDSVKIIVTPNPEQVMLAFDSSWYRRLLQQADIVLADGVGIGVADRVLSSASYVHRNPGVECMEHLCTLSSRMRLRIGFVGGRDGVAAAALRAVCANDGGIQGVAYDGKDVPQVDVGEISEDIRLEYEKYAKEIVRTVHKEKIRMLFLGFGAPKQELLASTVAKEYTKNPTEYPLLIMVVGGAFSMLSGKLRRAPLWMRRVGMEWLWRLILEPWRIVRQTALLRFLWIVLQTRFRQKR